eukprot:CAMPEP_0172184228 /NCGR_PEP_ID=MMETSP1050-20130122/19450_1 /TAXON_ID=233186 /ORGANISM="Cryptomonas curvata, Strain CCAP979/52" /LENGTH=266 /DNA_ID=CAMNT_0012857985 /DNA_START=381 /DNA_END=1180 /DNA_ORIENTATION=-
MAAVDISSAMLVYSHVTPSQRHDAPFSIAACAVLNSPLNGCALTIQDIQDTSSSGGQNSSVPMLKPPSTPYAPSAGCTPASTSIVDSDSDIAIGPAASPQSPPAAAPAHQRGPLPVLVRRGKASSPPLTLPADAAQLAEAGQAQAQPSRSGRSRAAALRVRPQHPEHRAAQAAAASTPTKNNDEDPLAKPSSSPFDRAADAKHCARRLPEAPRPPSEPAARPRPQDPPPHSPAPPISRALTQGLALPASRRYKVHPAGGRGPSGAR